jgi:hypothetical protein
MDIFNTLADAMRPETKPLHTSKHTEEVLHELNRRAEYCKGKFENGKQLINDDFGFQLSWQLQDMVMNHELMKLYQTTALIVEEEGAETGLHTALDKWKHYLSRLYNVRESSTNEVANMTSTWKYICKVEVCEVIETLMKKPKLNLEKK